ncbi:MAG TPA: FAD-binding oxidoreductase [Microscillaceae bacterium]|nr:FAD-binding oxidoreductase [Microscillaceae bacterium]
MNTDKKNIWIVGAGVTGLTTGVRLLQEGHSVTIVAKEFSPNTTSDIAAAIWFPFKVNPRAKALEWSRFTYTKLEGLLNTPEAGVSMTSSLRLLSDPSRVPWWTNALPKNRIRKATTNELPKGYEAGYQMEVPLIEVPQYMRYLYNQFVQLGGKMIQKIVVDLDELLVDDRWVINCTGLGARQLVNDPALFAIQGQILHVKSEEPLPTISDNEGGDIAAYIIPRKNYYVLGGTAFNNEYSTQPKEEISKEIWARCEAIVPQLKNAEYINTVVGLRPARKQLRLEKEPHKRIIHNYGHGGAGFSVSWGCAEAVAQLVAKASVSLIAA